ncbi:MAG: deoxyribonuclease IV [Planctomycetes bacterium]|nr:deoxyribonuclease IV [Planctomycetota bacterium]
MYLGAHVSIAGGVDLAFERGTALGCTAIQVFTKSSNQWKARPLPDDEVARWKTAWKESGIGPVVAHDSYLINLASPDDELWKKSIDSYHEEIVRCETLGIESLVMHPGSGKGEDVGASIARVARAFDEVHERTKGFRVRTLLETTAGQGATLGRTFEELAAIRDKVAEPERVGVCLDTCHVFAAGYAFGTKQEFETLLAEFDRVLGLALPGAIHVNDSVYPFGSRKDRHAGLGQGEIGEKPIAHFLREKRFREIPFVLETPEDGHAKDLAILERLAKGGR